MEISQSDTNYLFKGRQTFYIQHKNTLERCQKGGKLQVMTHQMECLRSFEIRESGTEKKDLIESIR